MKVFDFIQKLNLFFSQWSIMGSKAMYFVFLVYFSNRYCVYGKGYFLDYSEGYRVEIIVRMRLFAAIV